MKKLFFILFLLISAICFGQTYKINNNNLLITDNKLTIDTTFIKSIGIETLHAKHAIAVVGSSTTNNHLLNLVNSNYNKDRTTYTQATDTSSFNFGFTSTGKPIFNIKNNIGTSVLDVDSAGNLNTYIPYGSWLDTTDQLANVNKPVAVKFNVTGLEDSITIDAGDSVFTFYYTGKYLITFSAIIMPSAPSKTYELFLKVNGSNYPMSNTKFNSVGTNQARVITVTYIVNVSSGQTFQLMWFSDDSSGKLDYTTATKTAGKERPVCPSIILTCNKVSY